MAAGGSLAPRPPSEDVLRVVFQVRTGIHRGWNGEAVDHCQNATEALAESRELPVDVTRDLGKLRIQDAIFLYEATDLIVAPHGAGLSNAVFLRAGSGVIEMCHTKTAFCRWFADDLRAMGHRVMSLFCPTCSHRGPMRMDGDEVAEMVVHFAATKAAERAEAKKGGFAPEGGVDLVEEDKGLVS
mmetsp:Transcript_12790/g.32391  ORF Transcript_12790/g.32391 Transcript_12790/m.32391 type:complete len:185 (+) Transcript_12790:1-555(+)